MWDEGRGCYPPCQISPIYSWLHRWVSSSLTLLCIKVAFWNLMISNTKNKKRTRWGQRGVLFTCMTNLKVLYLNSRTQNDVWQYGVARIWREVLFISFIFRAWTWKISMHLICCVLLRFVFWNWVLGLSFESKVIGFVVKHSETITRLLAGVYCSDLDIKT